MPVLYFPFFFLFFFKAFISFRVEKCHVARGGKGEGEGDCLLEDNHNVHDTIRGEFAGLANNLWRHGGPTAAFVHLCTAMCFLLPSLLMEARLIHAGFLPKGNMINIHFVRHFILFDNLRRDIQVSI